MNRFIISFRGLRRRGSKTTFEPIKDDEIKRSDPLRKLDNNVEVFRENCYQYKLEYYDDKNDLRTATKKYIMKVDDGRDLHHPVDSIGIKDLIHKRREERKQNSLSLLYQLKALAETNEMKQKLTLAHLSKPEEKEEI